MVFYTLHLFFLKIILKFQELTNCKIYNILVPIAYNLHDVSKPGNELPFVSERGQLIS